MCLLSDFLLKVLYLFLHCFLVLSFSFFLPSNFIIICIYRQDRFLVLQHYHSFFCCFHKVTKSFVMYLVGSVSSSPICHLYLDFLLPLSLLSLLPIWHPLQVLLSYILECEGPLQLHCFLILTLALPSDVDDFGILWFLGSSDVLLLSFYCLAPYSTFILKKIIHSLLQCCRIGLSLQ